MQTSLKLAKNTHFIGIGGIGISAIARMLHAEGKKVSGSDREESRITGQLRKKGVEIVIGQKAENIPKDCDLIIYTNALGADNPELLEAKKRGIPALSYPQALAEISKEKFTIAISGTHGKTTTTAMVAKILIDAGLDPTVIVGSLMKFSKDSEETNFISGKSEYLVVEADEYKRAFLNLSPKILAINNLDLDHLDYYKDLADIQSAFGELAKKISPEGALVCNAEDPHVLPVAEGAECDVYNYPDIDLSDVSLKMPGEHNKKNAQVAAGVCGLLGVSKQNIKKTLKDFEGVWRRFEFKGETSSGAIVYDDYAHNPQKVAAVLFGAKEAFPGKKVIAVFQPHLFSRTKLLFEEFLSALSEADEVILLPIYAAREKNDPSISSELLCDALERKGFTAKSFSDFQSTEKYLKDTGTKNHLILTIGAGDVYKIGEAIIQK